MVTLPHLAHALLTASCGRWRYLDGDELCHTYLNPLVGSCQRHNLHNNSETVARWFPNLTSEVQRNCSMPHSSSHQFLFASILSYALQGAEGPPSPYWTQPLWHTILFEPSLSCSSWHFCPHSPPYRMLRPAPRQLQKPAVRESLWKESLAQSTATGDEFVTEGTSFKLDVRMSWRG